MNAFILAADSAARFELHHLCMGVLSAAIYGVLAIGLIVLGFKAFDWVTPKLNIEKELGENHNIAVAIVIGAAVAGICYLMAQIVAA